VRTAIAYHFATARNRERGLGGFRPQPAEAVGQSRTARLIRDRRVFTPPPDRPTLAAGTWPAREKNGRPPPRRHERSLATRQPRGEAKGDAKRSPRQLAPRRQAERAQQATTPGRLGVGDAGVPGLGSRARVTLGFEGVVRRRRRRHHGGAARTWPVSGHDRREPWPQSQWRVGRWRQPEVGGSKTAAATSAACRQW
jgi:hypothetical protein